MGSELTDNITVGEIVARDFRAAAVFRDAGIDFCCGGKKGLIESCIEKGIDRSELEARLEQLKDMPRNSTMNFIDWAPGFLCDYIVNTHHSFVRKSLPELVWYTAKISEVHGESHPELKEVQSLFSDINRELLQHLDNEERILFPAVKDFERSFSRSAAKRILDEIKRLSDEHEFAGRAMDRMNEITGGYQVPADGCNTYNVTFRLLQSFEDDLHVHVHLENNILFPRLQQK